MKEGDKKMKMISIRVNPDKWRIFSNFMKIDGKSGGSEGIRYLMDLAISNYANNNSQRKKYEILFGEINKNDIPEV